MYLNGMGFRAIERVMGVHHTTVMDWVKQKGKKLPDAIASENIPDVGKLDELETFVGSKKAESNRCPHWVLTPRSFTGLALLILRARTNHYPDWWA